MVGAILGLDKEEYHETLNWQKVRVGVALRAPLLIFRAAINLLNTKDGTDKFFRPKAGAVNFRIQIPYEFLKEPAFRIYLGDLPEAIAAQLASSLKAGRTAYTPCLGLAQCLAEVAWIGEEQAEVLQEHRGETSCAVPLDNGVQINYESGRRYQRLRIPAVMDGQRLVHRYQEVVIAEDAKPIRVEGAQLWRLSEEVITFV
jgi:CRISPR-associated protein Cas5h